jgi:hypothetical protein
MLPLKRGPEEAIRPKALSMFSKTARIAVVTFGFIALLPLAASAQSAFSGSVKDTSGAILPGVTVEAASPALIEKVRSVVT